MVVSHSWGGYGTVPSEELLCMAEGWSPITEPHCRCAHPTRWPDRKPKIPQEEHPTEVRDQTSNVSFSLSSPLPACCCSPPPHLHPTTSHHRGLCLTGGESGHCAAIFCAPFLFLLRTHREGPMGNTPRVTCSVPTLGCSGALCRTRPAETRTRRSQYGWGFFCPSVRSLGVSYVYSRACCILYIL